MAAEAAAAYTILYPAVLHTRIHLHTGRGPARMRKTIYEREEEEEEEGVVEEEDDRLPFPRIWRCDANS